MVMTLTIIIIKAIVYGVHMPKIAGYSQCSDLLEIEITGIAPRYLR